MNTHMFTLICLSFLSEMRTHSFWLKQALQSSNNK
uniref:Uncharacterized protein n=1 Tax=Anguilla anguilla TaxID=7936 RepID=A0A0E9QWH4_ANGAN